MNIFVRFAVHFITLCKVEHIVTLFSEARNSFFGNIEYLVSLKSSLQALSNDVFGLFGEFSQNIKK